jgi:hypothetical protein
LIAVGAIATFANHTEDEKLKSSITRTSKNSYFSLMPSVKFNWLRRPNWGLYSKLAAGATLRHSSKKKKNPSMRKKQQKIRRFSISRFRRSALRLVVKMCAVLPNSVSASRVLA